MKNVMLVAAALTAQAPCLGALRCDILALLIGNRLFTQEEQLLANHHVHECEDAQRLVVWLDNVGREAERRALAFRALVDGAREAGRGPFNSASDELARLAECPALTRMERMSAAYALPQLSCKTEAVVTVGRLYISLLHRIGKLDERYGYAE